MSHNLPNSSEAPIDCVQDSVAFEKNKIAMLKDSVSSIKKSALHFLSGTALSRVSGMVRDMVLAFAFGTHEAIAALFVAFRLSHVCRRLFGEGALQSAFIPLFEELRKDSSERAFRFFRDLSFLLTAFLTVFVIASMIILAVLKNSLNWSPGNTEIITLMIILMPSLIPICLFGVNISLLQCQKRYFISGIAPAFFNIIITIGALLLRKVDPRAAMPYIAVAIVIGCAVQWFVTFAPSLKQFKEVFKGNVIGPIKLLSKDVRLLASSLALGLLGVGASQINNTIDSLFARYADPEGPAQLWYGIRLQQLPLALFGIALSGALLPPLSRAVQAGKMEEYRHFIEFALRRVTALLLPCTVLLYVAGTHIINLVFGRGDFQSHSIFTTTGCLHGYALGLLPMGFIMVFAPAFYSFRDFKTPAYGAVLSLTTNFVLNAVMVFVFDWKAVSVALATSISCWLNVYYLYNRLEKKTPKLLTENGAEEFIKVISVTLFSGAITWLFQARFLHTASFFNFFAHASEQLPRNLIGQIMAVLMPFLVFFSFLIGFAWIVRASDILQLFRIKRKPALSNSSSS